MSAVKMIYAGIRALGIEEEDDRRDLYQRITGKRGLREMTPAEKNAVVSELRRLGFKVAAPPRKLDGPFAKKLQALWIAGWNLGLIRSADDAALLAFIKRQTGIDHPRWLRDPYLWIIASAVLPDDADDAPAQAQIVLENLDAQLTEVLRSYTDMATVAVAVVEAATPNLIESEWHGMLLSTADGTSAEITLSLSRDEIELEHFPAGRMTRQKFPGLWR